MSIKTISAVAGVAIAFATISVAEPALADDTVVVTDSGASGPNPFLFTSGLLTTAVSYGPAVLVAMNSPRAEDDYLYAPLVGPWLDLAARDDSFKDDGLNRGLLVVDGIFQAVGVLQLAASFMFIDSGDTANGQPAQVQATLVPSRMPNNGYGLSAVGTF